jgi:methionine-rich copper-binding protein CopC
MKTIQTTMARILVMAAMLSLWVGSGQAAVRLDQSCVVSILNRTVQVDANGSWAMPNVPSTMGRVKARATCLQKGQTTSGESDYFNIVPNGIVKVGQIKFEDIEQLPVAVAFSDPNPFILSSLTAKLQLFVNAIYPDGSQKDVSLDVTGINYSSTNPAIAEVSENGLVSAKAVGSALISARKDGAIAVKRINVEVVGDADGDGLPNDYEKAHDLNPNDPIDALEDPDQDGLSNLDEYQAGTDPQIADSDGDGLSDGDEVLDRKGYKTNPVRADTDGDGLNDGVEILVGSNPLDNQIAKLSAALVSIRAIPNTVSIVYNAVSGESAEQLKIIGNLVDGSTLDLTAKSRGTSYTSSNLDVVSFGAKDGLLYAGQAGSATVTVANSGLTTTVPVTVEEFTPKALSAIDIPGYANNVDVAGDYAYVAAGSAGLVVVNVTDRSNPAIVGRLDTPGISIDVRVMGNLAYLADGEAGLQIIDVTDPSQPKLLATYDTPGIAQDLKLDNRYAYVADGDNGLEIVDIQDPKKPVAAGHLGDLDEVKGVDVEGDTAVVVSQWDLWVVDVADRLNPVRHGSVYINRTKDVAINAGYAYVAAYSDGWKVIDITDPDYPNVIGGEEDFYPRDVELTEGLAFFAEQLFPNVIAYLNISDPYNVVFQGTIDLSPLGDFAGTGIALDGSYAYVTEESYYVSDDYMDDETTRLFIAQYRLLRDSQGVAPTVSITAPSTDIGMVAGRRIAMSVVASDDVAVAAVNFSVNDQIVFTDTTRPYQAIISVPSDGNSVRLGATAIDLGNNVGTATDIALTVQPDSDRDGLGDDDEIDLFHTDPRKLDTDEDGLSDGDEELMYKSDPLNRDTDGDSIDDGAEMINGTDPLNPDTTPPTVIAISPAYGATGIPKNSPVTVTFNEPLKVKSAQFESMVIAKNGGSIPGQVRLSGDRLKLVFKPDQALDDFTAYTVEVKHIRDAAGNSIAVPFVSGFTTGDTLDTTPPRVIAINPFDDAENVPVNAAFTVSMSEPIDAETLNRDSVDISDDITGFSVSGSIQVSADSRSFSFMPDKALTLGRRYNVYLSWWITDLFGTPKEKNDHFSFQTAFSRDDVAPVIEQLNVQDGQTGIPTNALLNIRFNEPVSHMDLADIKLARAGDGQAITVQRTLNSDHRTLTLDPIAPLEADTSYTLTVTGVEDLAGNRLATVEQRSFTTGEGSDTQEPNLVSYTPANGAVDVPMNAPIRLTFDERIDPAMLGGTELLSNNMDDWRASGGSLELSADGKTVTLIPSVPLKAGRTYAVNVANFNYGGVKDLAGNGPGNNTYTFTTGQTDDITAPEINLPSIPDGASGVPVNAQLAFRFTEPLSDQCLPGSDSVQVSTNSIKVAGTGSLSSDHLTLSFRPTQALQVSTVYSVKLTGLCDLAGNVLTEVSQDFTTTDIASADTTLPGVTIQPANGSSVAVTTPITFAFTEAVDPTTLDSGITVSVNGFPGEVAGNLVLEGTTATFTPTTPFPANAQITVQVSGVQDLAGNGSSYRSLSFQTTVDGVDITPPAVVSITPADGAVDLGTVTPIVLNFSESLDADTIDDNTFVLYADGHLIRPNVSRSADNRTVTLRTNLPAANVISVVVTDDLKDLSGNRLSNYISTFATAVAGTATRPIVTVQYPPDGADQVPLDTRIVLFTSTPLAAATMNSASFHVLQNGELVAGSLQVTNNGLGLEFIPTEPWRKDALIQIFLDNQAKDIGGHPFNRYEGSFWTFGSTLGPPWLVANEPSYDAPLNPVIDLLFSEPLDPATVTSESVILRNWDTRDAVPSSVSLIKGGQVIRVMPNDILAANTWYFTDVGNTVRDLQGERRYGLNWASATDFITGPDPDRRAPKVAAISPVNGLDQVGINAHLHIRFDEPINSISLFPESLETARYTVAFDDDDEVRYLTFEPYPVSSTMVESVSTTEDYAGNPVVPPYSTTFETAPGPDTTRPKVTEISPPSGTNIPVNAVITVRFSEAIDPITVNNDNLSIYGYTIGKYVAGNWSISTDGTTATFVPSQTWPMGQQFRMGTSSYLADLSGNRLQNSYYDINFNTAFAPDTAAPVLLQASVGDGQTGLPLNAMLSLQFSEPVNIAKLDGIELKRNDNRKTVKLKRTSSDDHRTITVASLLSTNTGYTLTVAGIEDLAGNPLATVDIRTFTTGTTIDTREPKLVSITPSYGATNVPLNTAISMTFDERIDPATLDASYMLRNSMGDYQNVTLSLSTDGKTVTLTPETNLTAGRTLYSISIDNYAGTGKASDFAGNYVGNVSSYFTTTAGP